jgi:Rha family phage regulatory protein
MKDRSIVTLHGDHPATNTQIIAEYFGKNHKDVMRDLRSLMADCDEDFNGRNFAPVEYYDKKGEKRPMYEVTKKGFMLLSMGFTGANATKLKIAFIDEFERMEAALHHPQQRPGQIEEMQFRLMREELLKANPLWGKIARYDGMGLSTLEICILIQRSPRTLSRHRGRMKACGLLSTAASMQLQGQSQGLPLHFHDGGVQ